MYTVIHQLHHVHRIRHSRDIHQCGACPHQQDAPLPTRHASVTFTAGSQQQLHHRAIFTSQPAVSPIHPFRRQKLAEKSLLTVRASTTGIKNASRVVGDRRRAYRCNYTAFKSSHGHACVFAQTEQIAFVLTA